MSRNLRIDIYSGWQDEKKPRDHEILYISTDEELYNILELVSRSVEDKIEELIDEDKEGTWGYSKQAS